MVQQAEGIPIRRRDVVLAAIFFISMAGVTGAVSGETRLGLSYTDTIRERGIDPGNTTTADNTYTFNVTGTWIDSENKTGAGRDVKIIVELSPNNITEVMAGKEEPWKSVSNGTEWFNERYYYNGRNITPFEWDMLNQERQNMPFIVDGDILKTTNIKSSPKNISVTVKLRNGDGFDVVRIGNHTAKVTVSTGSGMELWEHAVYDPNRDVYHAAWVNDSADFIYSNSTDGGENWNHTTFVDTDSTSWNDQPRAVNVMVDDQGDPHFVYWATELSTNEIRYREGLSGAWTTVVSGDAQNDAEAAMAEDGTVYVSVIDHSGDSNGGSGEGLDLYEKPSGGSFSRVVDGLCDAEDGRLAGLIATGTTVYGTYRDGGSNRGYWNFSYDRSGGTSSCTALMGETYSNHRDGQDVGVDWKGTPVYLMENDTGSGYELMFTQDAGNTWTTVEESGNYLRGQPTANLVHSDNTTHILYPANYSGSEHVVKTNITNPGVKENVTKEGYQEVIPAVTATGNNSYNGTSIQPFFFLNTAKDSFFLSNFSIAPPNVVPSVLNATLEVTAGISKNITVGHNDLDGNELSTSSGSPTSLTNHTALFQDFASPFDLQYDVTDFSGAVSSSRDVNVTLTVAHDRVENATGAVNESWQVVNTTVHGEIRGEAMNRSADAATPTGLISALQDGDVALTTTGVTGAFTDYWYWKVDNVDTTVFSERQDNSTASNTSTQTLYRSKQFSNTWSTTYNRFTFTAPTITGMCMNCGDAVGTLSGNSEKNQTYNSTGDWVNENEFGFAPASNLVTLGQNYTGVRVLQLNETGGFSWTNLGTTSGVSTPSQCSQSNNTAVDLNAGVSTNVTVGFDCEVGTTGAPTTTFVADSPSADYRRVWFNITGITLHSNKTKSVRIRRSIPRTYLEHYDDRATGSLESYVDGLTANQTVTGNRTHVFLTVGTNFTANRSLAAGAHTMALTYYFPVDDGSSAGGLPSEETEKNDSTPSPVKIVQRDGQATPNINKLVYTLRVGWETAHTASYTIANQADTPIEVTVRKARERLSGSCEKVKLINGQGAAADSATYTVPAAADGGEYTGSLVLDSPVTAEETDFTCILNVSTAGHVTEVPVILQVRRTAWGEALAMLQKPVLPVNTTIPTLKASSLEAGATEPDEIRAAATIRVIHALIGGLAMLVLLGWGIRRYSNDTR